jgi:D-glycerate 3-kinase
MKVRARHEFSQTEVALLADRVLALASKRRTSPPWVVGLSGVPGSGKSTLARELADECRRRGIETAVLALDDFYLGRRARHALAQRVHPLFLTRGPAGTHDIGQLARIVDALRVRAPIGTIALPRFDRLRDTRLPPSRWRTLRHRPRLVILEGWLVGVPALPARQLEPPVNELERVEDRDGRWRRAANAALRGPYAAVWRKLDALVALLPPDLAAMRRWRREAERGMARRRPGARPMGARDLDRFLQHFERWARHAMAVLPERADIVLRLDPRHRIVSS